MKKRKEMRFFYIGCSFLLVFLLFTVLVKHFDVQAIGPNHSQVGFATINHWFFTTFGENLLWYHITDWLGIIPMLFALGFAIAGLVQLIQKKSLKKVDKTIIALGLFYLVLVAIYLFFEKVPINFRPVLMEGKLEASYPSTHTLLVISIMSTTIMQLKIRLKNKKVCHFVCLLSASIIIIVVFGRLISGVHWLSDIFGGVLLSSSLCFFYYVALTRLQSSNQK